LCFLEPKFSNFQQFSAIASNVPLRQAKKSDGSWHCECVISCVDDALAISEHAVQASQDLRQDSGMKQKKDEIEPPEMCSGHDHRRKRLLVLTEHVGPLQALIASTQLQQP